MAQGVSHFICPQLYDDDEGQTPLHMAIVAGHLDVVEILIRDASHHLDMKSRDEGMTALHYAAQGGHVAILQALLDAGASVDIVDFEGRMPPLQGPPRGSPGCRKHAEGRRGWSEHR